MEVVDAFCGAGGFSAGAMVAGCRVTMGIDSDPVPLKLWAANTAGRAVCATIGRDAVEWPEARPGVVEDRFANLALSCVHQEYPNKISHVLQGDMKLVSLCHSTASRNQLARDQQCFCR